MTDQYEGPPPPEDGEDVIESTPAEGESRSAVRFALAIFGIALLVALAAALAGFGSRWGLWHFGTGFRLLRWAAYGAIAAAALSVAALFWSRRKGSRGGFALALAGLVLSVVVLAVPLQHRQMAGGAPPIHDITTDTEDPPRFVAIAPLRADASNPVEYAGADAARLQRQAYPDIRPLILDLPPERAFQRALDVAEEQGWEIVDQSASEGRIEATARTFWFGFRDDVVIRLTPLGGRTVVDIRSKSRVGRGDMGANARRIRDYLGDLDG
jgi:uncharacterized protein (DUF1499 family)